jgi:hypothetical protein
VSVEKPELLRSETKDKLLNLFGQYIEAMETDLYHGDLPQLIGDLVDDIQKLIPGADKEFETNHPEADRE